MGDVTTGEVTDLSPEGLDDPTTPDPAIEHITQGEVAWYIPFQLKVSHNLAIDLGLDADALKIVPFDETTYNSTGKMETPTIPVDATIDFGFTFGVNTGGQELTGESIGTEDFFVRSADDLVVSVTSNDPDFDSLLNIGFLGAEVVNGNIDLQVNVETELIDPNSPSVLGFDVDQYGYRDDTGTITANDPIPSANLAHEAQFTLRIGNLGMVKEVTVADNDRDNLNDLLDDVNQALNDADLDDLITASLIDEDSEIPGVDTLQFSLISTTDTPFGFANESIGLSGVLSGTPDSGDATYPYEYASDVTFLLSVGGAVPELVTVGFPDTAQTELGFDDSQTAILPDLVGQNNANANIGGDGTATFYVKVTHSDGTVTDPPVAVSVTEALYTPALNTSLTELNSDLIIALANAGLNSLILSEVQGNKIALYAWDPTVSAIEITSADTETQNSIGFVAGQRSTLALTAVDTPISSFDLTDDAHLKLTIATTDGNANVEVTIPADLNDDAAALAADINLAIDTALTTLGNKINVEVDTSGKLVLKAADSTVLSFSITTVNTTIDDLVDDVNRALDQAGLTSVTASTDGTNLILTEDDGKTLEITKTLALDAGFTYTELQRPDPDEPGGNPEDGTATETLFDVQPGDDSEISFKLPVEVLPGLQEARHRGKV